MTLDEINTMLIKYETWSELPSYTVILNLASDLLSELNKVLFVTDTI